MKVDRLIFVSFGSDSYYAGLARELTDSFKVRYASAETRVFTGRDIPLNVSSLYERSCIGYGFWCWKAYIINRTVSQLEDGDVVVYADARSVLTGSRVSWIDSILGNEEIELCCARQKGLKERDWTSKELLESVSDSVSEDGEEDQVFAGFFSLRVTYQTRKLCQEWLTLQLEEKDLVRGSWKGKEGRMYMSDRRYDQSVLSLLVKRYARNGMSMCWSELRVGEDDGLVPQIRPPKSVGMMKRWMKRLKWQVLYILEND